MNSERERKSRPLHPEKMANFISRIIYFWTLKLFRLGYKRPLANDDMYETLYKHKSEHLGKSLKKYWDIEIQRAERKKRNPSLVRAITKMFALQMMKYGVFYASVEISVCACQPFFISMIIQSIEEGEHRTSTFNKGLYGVIGLVVTCLIRSLSNHWEFQGMGTIGMNIRVAVSACVYQKALRLSKMTLEQTTIGQIVNLLSNDVNRFDSALLFIHFLWIAPLAVLTVIYFIYQQVQWAAIAGVIVLFCFVPLQTFLGVKTSKYRLETAVRTDERVRLMDEILNGIQVIKMYTWEKPFIDEVHRLRKREMDAIKQISYMRGILLSFIIYQGRIALFLSVFLYASSGYKITASKVFILSSYYYLLRQIVTSHFAQGIGQVGELLVSINRIQKFLELKETVAVLNKAQDSDDPLLQDPIVLSNVYAKWYESDTEYILSDLNVTIERGGLVGVIGRIGAGKSSFLQLILKELPISRGTIAVNGSTSYVSQEPWLFPGTIRQNILFGIPMNKKRYDEVIYACALKRDFEQLPGGDMIKVGEKGAGLSGGQRARVNLARAVYREADIYLLDDPLSAVDPSVSKHIFKHCVKNFLNNKTVVLITHQLQHLVNVNNIIALQGGKILGIGSFQVLRRLGIDFGSLQESPQVIDDNASTAVLDTSLILCSVPLDPKLCSEYKAAMTLFSRDDYSSVQDSTERHDSTLEMNQVNKVGAIKSYFASSGSWFYVISALSLCLLSQISVSTTESWITYWVHLEEDVYPCVQNSSGTPESCNRNLPRVYPSRSTALLVYSIMCGFMIVVTTVRSLGFIKMCVLISTNLHNAMFNGIARTPMRFFDTHPAGRILNRFSKDMGYVDEMLPPALFDTIQIFLTVIGIIIISSFLNPYLIVVFACILIIFYFIRGFYLATSLNLKRLEASARSPIFNHLSESLHGLSTIRSFQVQEPLAREFDEFQDFHSSVWYSYLSTSRALAIWVDFVCLMYIALAALSFVIIFKDISSAKVGLIITQSISLNGVSQWGMRQSTEAENYMTSVERIIEYTNQPSEADWDSSPDLKPPPTWPSRGEIIFEHMYLRYDIKTPYVLKDLNVQIEPEQKVGIVGRTGAGKSTIVAALFRLAINEGEIRIDGIDINKLSLHDVRSKISIIPQEPVLFSGTMRKNLDPFDEYSDAILWDALEEVELKHEIEYHGQGLNAVITEGGFNLSVGQRQLVCLARAIIRNNKILVLDEATANVDPRTDVLIQVTIRKRFKHCTVLTVAHRLNTVMDSDKIMVIDGGTCVEFNHPHLLLRKEGGLFKKMVEKTGRATAAMLKNIAAQRILINSILPNKMNFDEVLVEGTNINARPL